MGMFAMFLLGLIVGFFLCIIATNKQTEKSIKSGYMRHESTLYKLTEIKPTDTIYVKAKE